MDTVLRGATVVDGTGAPGRRADVGVEAGRIAAVGTVDHTDGATVVDLDGLVLAPGFIDPHTHYDAQLLWDPDVTPSSWQGVTTVVVGNCGFGIAPTRPEHRPTIMRTLENVEGMPLAALEEGIRWEFESFPEYLDVLERTPTRANVAVLAGHTPLRFFVMGDDATERPATDDELARMRALLSEAVGAGALGFSTSRSGSHVGAYGLPVPSRAADLHEIWELAGVLKEHGRGVVEAAFGPDLHVDECAQLSDDIGRPVSWAAIVTLARDPALAADLVRRVEAREGQVYPQITCRPLVVQIALSDPFPFANVPSFGEILSLPHAERAARYADERWRAEARPGIRAAWGAMLDTAVVAETAKHSELVEGPALGVLAAERGVDSLDVMVDLSLDESLETRFRVTMTNDSEDQVGELLGHKRLMLGLGDAGAHTSQLCDANYATYLLARFVRERGDITLEDAVWRLTGQPATVYGIADRGRVAPGAIADLVAFDPTTVAPTPLERVHDFPGGADRLISQSVGIEHIWVRGVPVRASGVDIAGTRPGRLLRGGVG